VGSPSTQEALLAQLEVLAETQTIPDLADKAIREGMDMLSRRQYLELSRLLEIPTRQAKAIARFIGDNLNPFPARAYWGDIRQGKGATPTVYTYPDVVITPMDPGSEPVLMVEIVSPYAGLLQVNPLFRQAIGEAPAEKADQWRSDLEHAELLVKCLQQRTNTVVRLMREIVTCQRDFILKGDGYLRPLTRAKLAVELEVHESTISRAVSSKTAQLPNGHIIPLAKFFDRSLHIRTALKEIIEQETKPYSDTELVDLLNEQGFSVARRTVAKYRSMEGILPSHLRPSRARSSQVANPDVQIDPQIGLSIDHKLPIPVFIPQEVE
jgi:RNA polymerase sigma-54 factor